VALTPSHLKSPTVALRYGPTLGEGSFDPRHCQAARRAVDLTLPGLSLPEAGRDLGDTGKAANGPLFCPTIAPSRFGKGDGG